MRGCLLGLIMLLWLWPAPIPAHAQSQKRCPEKVLDSGTVEGLYGGVMCGDFCHVSIRLDDGEEFSLIEGPVDAAELFGQMGNRVSVTYELQQFWSEFGNDCLRTEVLKSGKILVSASPAKPPVAPTPINIQPGIYAVCLLAGENGLDCLKPNSTGVDFWRTIEVDQSGYDSIGADEDIRPFTWQRQGSTLTLTYQNGEKKQAVLARENLFFEGGRYYLLQAEESDHAWEPENAPEEYSPPPPIQTQAQLIGPAIKGLQLGMTEAQFVEAAKRHFPHVFKVEAPLGGRLHKMYIMTYQDPQERAAIAGVGPISPVAAVNALLQNLNNSQHTDAEKAGVFNLIINGLSTVASIAYFSFDENRLHSLWLTESHLRPLFNVSPTLSKPFLQAFANAYGLSLEAANDRQYTSGPPDFSWLLTITLHGSGVSSISLDQKNASFD